MQVAPRSRRTWIDEREDNAGETVLIHGDSYFAGDGPRACSTCQIGLMRFARQILPSWGHSLTERGSPSRTNNVSRLAEKGSDELADEDVFGGGDTPDWSSVHTKWACWLLIGVR